VIERLEPGLVLAAGHGMLGVTLAPATATRVASLL
jgi:glycine/D-amino acid oxidase-like deaminating enzyme